MNALGKEGEQRAKTYLENRGLTIQEQNFHSRFGEVDIIASSKNTLHFIEVKTSINYDPLERITPQKYEKLLKTINYYLYKHPTDLTYQLDAIIVHKEMIEWIENISLF